MDIKIDEDTLKKTTECEKNFSCLSGENECLCEAVVSSGNRFLFIDPKSNISCNHCMPFGNYFLCDCPTRNEIYRLYQI